MGHQWTTARRIMMTGVALAALAACEDYDFDLRDRVNGFDTSRAVQNLPGRPRPDARGVISYPTYQVVVAQQDDTVRGIANRLGLDANELARYNGIEPDVILRRDEIVALPNPLPDAAAAVPADGATGTGFDVTAVATTALDRAGAVTTTPLAPVAGGAEVTPVAAPAPAAPAAAEPLRHQVKRGETVFAISRLYNVPVKSIADWNGLNSEFTVRVGQTLLIPQGGVQAPAPQPTTTAVTAPGQGSVTPLPPSAGTPLPTDTSAVPVAAPAAPDLGTPAPAPASASARFVRPVEGSIVRAYAPGSNEGIDISAPAGTAVKAAGSGSVAAVTTDTNGMNILVIRHDDGLLTVYTSIDDLTVSKGDSVSSGQTVAKVQARETPILHFEVRRGLQSVDPTEYLP